MRPSFAPVLLLAALLHCPAARAYDHYDPVLLNEQAAQAVRDGDSETALILFERAARIFPRDPRIAANLEALRAAREGRPPRPPAGERPPGPAAAPVPQPPLAPEPPELWPQP